MLGVGTMSSLAALSQNKYWLSCQALITFYDVNFYEFYNCIPEHFIFVRKFPILNASTSI
jgi:hypothetical protein